MHRTFVQLETAGCERAMMGNVIFTYFVRSNVKNAQTGTAMETQQEVEVDLL